MTTPVDELELQYLQLPRTGTEAQNLDRQILALIPAETLARFGATHADLLPSHQTPWKSPTSRLLFATEGDRYGPPTAWSIGIRDARPSLEDLELVDGVWRQRRLSRRIQPDELAATLRAAGFTHFRYRTGNSGVTREATGVTRKATEATEETSEPTPRHHLKPPRPRRPPPDSPRRRSAGDRLAVFGLSLSAVFGLGAA